MPTPLEMYLQALSGQQWDPNMAGMMGGQGAPGDNPFAATPGYQPHAFGAMPFWAPGTAQYGYDQRGVGDAIYAAPPGGPVPVPRPGGDNDISGAEDRAVTAAYRPPPAIHPAVAAALAHGFIRRV